MNIKMQAGLDVVKFIAVGLGVGILTAVLLQTVPLAILGTLAAVSVFAYLVYVMYSIRVSQLETLESLKRSTDKLVK